MTGWRSFVVGMVVGGGLVLLGVIVGASLATSRSTTVPSSAAATADRGIVGSGAASMSPAVPTSTPTVVPTATPIPIVPCTLKSGQGAATVTFAAPAPNGMCQALLSQQSNLQGQSYTLCQSAGLNAVTAAACAVVLRRYLSDLAATPGAASGGALTCRGTVGDATYEVRDTGNQYVGRALCWHLQHESG